jgi:hypothetical protein
MSKRKKPMICKEIGQSIVLVNSLLKRRRTRMRRLIMRGMAIARMRTSKNRRP